MVIHEWAQTEKQEASRNTHKHIKFNNIKNRFSYLHDEKKKKDKKKIKLKQKTEWKKNI